VGFFHDAKGEIRYPFPDREGVKLPLGRLCVGGVSSLKQKKNAAFQKYERKLPLGKRKMEGLGGKKLNREGAVRHT